MTVRTSTRPATPDHMRLLHLGDVHLDRPFVGMDLDAARERRRDLRNAFERCLRLAAEWDVDAITIGGDLWEDEHVTTDTARWVAAKLGDVGVPVIVVAGNHDRLAPGGPYDRAGFGGSVRVLPASDTLEEQRVGDVSVWGSSWRRGADLTARGLRNFRVPDDGRRHILLLHGTCDGGLDVGPYCAFTVEDVRAAGFDLCLAGHLHFGHVRGGVVVYPGSPEPLGWSESGRHCAALVEFSEEGPTVELFDTNDRHYVKQAVDCTGAASSADLERALATAVQALDQPARTFLRAELHGRVTAGCQVDALALGAFAATRGVAAAEVRDRTEVAFDLDALAEGTGVTAVFVQRMEQLQAEAPDDPARRLAVQLGLRALAGDEL